MRELLEAGVHFGHQTRRWTPKMRRFIFTERGGIYIIDLKQTQELLDEAHDFARNLAGRGGTVLFVGTKKQSMDAIAEHAGRVGMPYVNHRWLGGLLTNWRTMSDRIERLHELRRLKEEGQLELLPAKERISMARDSYTFRAPEQSPAGFIEVFRRFYGDGARTLEFCGQVLGFGDIGAVGGVSRYQVGPSQLKFTRAGANAKFTRGAINDAAGVRLQSGPVENRELHR